MHLAMCTCITKLFGVQGKLRQVSESMRLCCFTIMLLFYVRLKMGECTARG